MHSIGRWVRGGIRRAAGAAGWAVAWLLAGTPVLAAAPPVVSSTGNGITNPLGSSTASVGSVSASAINYIMAFVYAIGGVWFIFHLYKAIMSLMAKSHQAQKRDEAKSHLTHVLVSGILLGGATLIAGVLFNFGSGL